MNSEEIRSLRNMLNLSQTQFGELVGVSTNTISSYENGGVIPKSKKEIFKKIKEDHLNKSTESTIYLEKNGVRIELIELVDHFVKNADAYYENSEYLQLWIKNKVEDKLTERIESIKLIGKKTN